MQDNSLRTLRKAAGWPTAKAFAESIGIPAPTYARYEQSGDGEDTNIPMKAAFAIADALGCSIDALVGREAISADAVRGDVQRRYDALSDDGKQLVEDFLAMAEMREERAEEQRLAALARVYMKDARKLELRYLESMDEESGDEGFTYLGYSENLRDDFEAFLINEVEKDFEHRLEAEKDRLRQRAHRWGHVRLGADDDLEAKRVPVDSPDFEGAINECAALFRPDLTTQAEERKKEVIEGIMAAYDSLHPDEGSRVEYAYVRLDVKG